MVVAVVVAIVVDTDVLVRVVVVDVLDEEVV